jgi:anti-sigma-K factor RskA
MSKRINKVANTIARYQQVNVVEHLASQFVLGTLSERVQKRVIALCEYNELLEQRIDFWQEKLVVIDKKTAELPPSEQSWAVIAQALDIDDTALQSSRSQTHKQGFFWAIAAWFSNTLFATPVHRLATAFSVVVMVLATLIVNPLFDEAEQLSYVAVLTQTSGDAHLVASTYGESKQLVLNVVNSPPLTKAQALELWVVSKTDLQARSLGVIPQGQDLITQQLTQAQWRLIKDSKSLIVTIEEAGGSPIGEPSELVVSRGLCVRLQQWNNNA